MTDGTGPPAGDDEAASASTVQVMIPADPARLPLLRSIAAALAMSLDLDIDTMADLRMAVDELGSTVLTRARPETSVSVEFVAADATVWVTARAAADDPAPIDKASFGWMVLTTLCRSVTASVDGAADGGSGSAPEVRLAIVVGSAPDVR